MDRATMMPAILTDAWITRMVKPTAPTSAIRLHHVSGATCGSYYGQAALEREIEAVKSAPTGQRNNTLNASALKLGSLFAGGEIDDRQDDLVIAAMYAGLPEPEARRTVDSGWRAGLKKPRTRPARKETHMPKRVGVAMKAGQGEKVPPDGVIAHDQEEERPPRTFALTETGGAELFADRLRGSVAFVPDWGRWLVWTGTHWKADVADVAIMDKTKLVAREFLDESRWAVDRDDARAKAFAQFAASAQRRNFRQAVLALSKSEPGLAVPFTAFNTDPYLLNCANGTVDLRNGELHPHRREDLITCVLPWHHDPAALCPRWQQFLREILPDEETVAFVQRAVGYSLTGDVSEHVLFFLHGLGANGKSVFLLTLLELLGDYGTQAPSSMLLAKHGEAHPTELTVLHGRRLAVCQETPSGRGWAEEILKHVTGGDLISARRMREDFWQFAPTHKLWISSNHLPPVRGTDEGIWRRLRLVPFEKVISEDKRDSKLAAKLRAEMPGILTWAVEGCLLWQCDRLGQSDKVRAATTDYREDSDRLGPFIAEVCVLEPRGVTPRPALYRAYVEWSVTQGERQPASEREVAELLRGRGLAECWTRANGKKCRGWRGINLAGNTGNTSPQDSSYDCQIVLPRETNLKTGGNVLPPVAGDSASNDNGALG